MSFDYTNDFKYLFISGNKVDLDDSGNNNLNKREMAQALAERYKLPFFQVSAKTGENLDVAFKHLTHMVLEAEKNTPLALSEPKILTLDTIPIHPREEKECCLTN